MALLIGKSRSWSGSFGGLQGEQAHLCKEALCQGESDLLLIHGSDLCHGGGGSSILLRGLTGIAVELAKARGPAQRWQCSPEHRFVLHPWASVPSPPHLDSQTPYMCCL